MVVLTKLRLKVLESFNMRNSKLVGIPLASHFKLSSEQCPTSENDKKDIKSVPYAYVVSSLTYDIVYTRPYIDHVVGVVSQFLIYLRVTSKVCLCFGSCDPVLDGYTDEYMDDDIGSRKSTSIYMIIFVRRVSVLAIKVTKCVA